jgi:hypothetical protein
MRGASSSIRLARQPNILHGLALLWGGVAFKNRQLLKSTDAIASCWSGSREGWARYDAVTGGRALARWQQQLQLRVARSAPRRRSRSAATTGSTPSAVSLDGGSKSDSERESSEEGSWSASKAMSIIRTPKPLSPRADVHPGSPRPALRRSPVLSSKVRTAPSVAAAMPERADETRTNCRSTLAFPADREFWISGPTLGVYF